MKKPNECNDDGENTVSSLGIQQDHDLIKLNTDNDGK